MYVGVCICLRVSRQKPWTKVALKAANGKDRKRGQTKDSGKGVGILQGCLINVPMEVDVTALTKPDCHH